MKALLAGLWHLLPMAVRHFLWQIIETAFRYYNLAWDHVMDWKYGVHTTLIRRYGPAEAARTGFQDPSENRPTSVTWVLWLRRHLAPCEQDVFLDLGCGSGRALFVFAQSPVKEARGVDFDDVSCELCAANVRSFRYDQSKVTVLNKDVCAFGFTDETIIYMANPFGIKTMEAVLKNLHDHLMVNPRPVTLCYYNPLHAGYLDALPWLKRTGELRNFKNCILIYKNAVPMTAR